MADMPNGRKRKLQLRLDDGSLIGSVESLLGNDGGSGTVLLDWEQACRTGRANKAELERLDKLISVFQGKVNGFHAIPRHEIKARNPYIQDVQRQIKRQRSLANGEVVTFASPEQHVPGDFLGKCWEVLNKVYGTCHSIGMIFNLTCKDVFFRPVSETFPTIAAHYYANVVHPITFREIEDKIKGGIYHNAQQFADDVRLLVNNCKGYNPTPTDPVRLAVLRISETFERAWVDTGLCAVAERARRTNAGIAAPKFEPEEYDGMLPRPHRSGGNEKRVPDALGRLQSHEVSSYREEEVEQHAIPQEVMTEVAEQLQELQTENLQVALSKFNEGVVSYDDEGEVELDLEKVDYASLMEVDTYIRQLNGLPPREITQQAGRTAAANTADPSEGGGLSELAGGRRGAVRAEQDDDDEYYGEEDESDDDD